MIPGAGVSEKMEITEDYRKAIALLRSPDRPNVFITGNAGTGKSTLLRYLVDEACRHQSPVVVAPTGVAALNVQGVTIHSFFRLAPKPMLTVKADVRFTASQKAIFDSLKMIIVDEISMVRADLLDCMDATLRLHRGKPDLPFGGVQMVFVGDLYQLPPVVKNDVRQHLEAAYETPYFFSAACLRNAQPPLVELRKPFRQQDDPRFLDILNRIRNDVLTLQDVNMLNVECKIGRPLVPETPAPIEITTTNDMADAINDRRLADIPAKEFVYHAIVSGKFDPKTCTADEHLALKVGSQVMMLRNDAYKRFVNGSIGRVTYLSPSQIVVKIEDEDGGTDCEIERETWEHMTYGLDAFTQTMETHSVGSFKQYPIRLGWAITIHKSQGKTFDRVVVDFGRGTFAHGQAYVALSRCRTMTGLRLRTSICRDDIQVDPRIPAYLESIRDDQ